MAAPFVSVVIPTRGGRAAWGEVIAFTDDDVVPTPVWIEAAVELFQGDIGGVSGRTLVPISAQPTDHERNTSGLEQSPYTTCNVFYRRADLAAVGGSTRVIGWPGARTASCTSNCARGAPMVVARDAVAIHPVRTAPFAHCVGDHRKIMYNALLYKDHPVLYRYVIQTNPPMHYYLTLAALVEVTLGLVTGRRRVAATAFGVWAVLTGAPKPSGSDSSHIEGVAP